MVKKSKVSKEELSEEEELEELEKVLAKEKEENLDSLNINIEPVLAEKKIRKVKLSNPIYDGFLFALGMFLFSLIVWFVLIIIFAISGFSLLSLLY